ncbi:GIP, partial [Symbiodinium pilosum]
ARGDGMVVNDKRMAIDMLLVRRDIRENNMVLRWVDARQMVADPPKKVNVDPSFLRFVMKTGE